MLHELVQIQHFLGIVEQQLSQHAQIIICYPSEVEYGTIISYSTAQSRGVSSGAVIVSPSSDASTTGIIAVTIR